MQSMGGAHLQIARPPHTWQCTVPEQQQLRREPLCKPEHHELWVRRTTHRAP